MCLLLSVKRRFSYLKLNICLGPDDFEDSTFPVWPFDHGSPAGHLLLVVPDLQFGKLGVFSQKLTPREFPIHSDWDRGSGGV